MLGLPQDYHPEDHQIRHSQGNRVESQLETAIEVITVFIYFRRANILKTDRV